jgi:hypothetical protein
MIKKQCKKCGAWTESMAVKHICGWCFYSTEIKPMTWVIIIQTAIIIALGVSHL